MRSPPRCHPHDFRGPTDAGLRTPFDGTAYLKYHAIVVLEESLSDWLSSTEAAARLGVTAGRVRELIASGTLRARRVGNRYLVRRDDVETRATEGPSPGRPFSPRRSWAIILLSSGVPPNGLDAVSLSKVKRVIRERDLWSIRRQLTSRAARREFRAHSSDLPRLEAERGVVLTGARYASEAGLSLVAPDAPVELYVDPDTAHRLIRRYRLRPSERPNVVLHVVPERVRDWINGRLAPRTAVALDLADDRDPRSQEVARATLSRTS